MLELKNIKKNKEYIKKARSLYNSAFPSAERIPFDILLYKAKGSNVTFFAVVDGSEFKGVRLLIFSVCPRTDGGVEGGEERLCQSISNVTILRPNVFPGSCLQALLLRR